MRYVNKAELKQMDADVQKLVEKLMSELNLTEAEALATAAVYYYITMDDAEKAEFNGVVPVFRAMSDDVAWMEELISSFGNWKQVPDHIAWAFVTGKLRSS
jgi:hypothetical protein